MISTRGEGAATRRYLRDLTARLGRSGYEPNMSSGHLTRCRTDDSPLCRGRVLVCGDAAGLLEPLTREGISYALRSGWLAGKWAVRIAEAADAAQARRQALNYTFAIKSELGAEMGAGRRLLAVFSRHPRMMHLDFAVSDLATLVRSAIEAGATEAEFQPQDDVRVMLDPHGHPFCLWFYPESSG